MKLKFGVETDVGRRRELNEDYHAIVKDKNLFIVCDGMGGYRHGEIASFLAIETVLDFYNKSPHQLVDDVAVDIPFDLEPHAKRLVGGIRLANHRIYRISDAVDDHSSMGTTIVAVVFVDNFVVVAHMGDSRCYRIREGVIERITRDHSSVQDLIDDGMITLKEAWKHPQRNEIKRALGHKPYEKIGICAVDSRRGDRFLLCSDGLNDELWDEEIYEHVVAGASDRDLGCKRLVKRANMAGGHDNISAMMVQVVEEGKISHPPGFPMDIEKESGQVLKKLSNIVANRFAQDLNIIKMIRNGEKDILEKIKGPEGPQTQPRWPKVIIAFASVLCLLFVIWLLSQKPSVTFDVSEIKNKIDINDRAKRAWSGEIKLRNTDNEKSFKIGRKVEDFDGGREKFKVYKGEYKVQAVPDDALPVNLNEITINPSWPWKRLTKPLSLKESRISELKNVTFKFSKIEMIRNSNELAKKAWDGRISFRNIETNVTKNIGKEVKDFDSGETSEEMLPGAYQIWIVDRNEKKIELKDIYVNRTEGSQVIELFLSESERMEIEVTFDVNEISDKYRWGPDDEYDYWISIWDGTIVLEEVISGEVVINEVVNKLHDADNIKLPAGEYKMRIETTTNEAINLENITVGPGLDQKPIKIEIER